MLRNIDDLEELGEGFSNEAVRLQAEKTLEFLHQMEAN